MTKNQLPSRGPDYGIAKILRGFPNFEDYYQGMPVTYPVALTPWGSPNMGRDPIAKANYDALSSRLAAQNGGAGQGATSPGVDGKTSPNLLEGQQTTFGANCVFGVPRSSPVLEGAQFVYKFIWRIRALDLFERSGKPYHSVLGGYTYSDPYVSTDDGFTGEPVFIGDAAKRGVIATFEETLRFTEPRPDQPSIDNKLGLQQAVDVGLQPIDSYAWPQSLYNGSTGATSLGSPLLPFAGAHGMVNPVTGKIVVPGEYGQNPLVSTAATGGVTGQIDAASWRNDVSLVTYSTTAKGDECLVIVYPQLLSNFPPESIPLYDFDDTDMNLNLSMTFGRGGYKNPYGLPTPFLPDGAPFGVYLIQGFDLPRDDLGAHGRHDRGRFPDVRCAQVDSHVLGPHPAREANGQRLRGEDLRRARRSASPLVGGKGVGDAHDLVRGHNELLRARLEPLQS